MDLVTMTYYGAICGMLALAGPRLSPVAFRFLAGVAVGLVAAWALPHLRQMLGP